MAENSLTGTFGATKATELANIFGAADMRVSTVMNISGTVDMNEENNFSSEGAVLSSPSGMA